MPTFGKTDDGPSNSSSSANRTSVSQATPASSGKVTAGAVRLYMDSGASTNTKCVIYADSAELPGAKLAESDVVNISNTTEAQINYTFSGANQIDIVVGTPYWIGAAWQDPGAGGTDNIRISRDGTASGRQENTSYAPDPFGTPTAQTGPVDAFITYTIVDPDDGAFFEFF